MSQPERSIFDEIDPDADARGLGEAEADVVAGGLVPHERVGAWLLSWGTADELPCPRWDEWGGHPLRWPMSDGSGPMSQSTARDVTPLAERLVARG